VTSALDGVSGQRHAPAALYPGKGPPVPTGQEAGLASELVWTQRLEEKSFASAGDRAPVVESIVRHYTDWVTLAPMDGYYNVQLLRARITAGRVPQLFRR
jgi:hypothetical protein